MCHDLVLTLITPRFRSSTIFFKMFVCASPEQRIILSSYSQLEAEERHF